MLVHIIPLFLVANMSSQDVSSWPKGPEIEFEMSMVGNLIAVSDKVSSGNGSYTAKFLCRPVEEKALRCVARDAQVSVAAPNISSTQSLDDSEAEYFDIQFNDVGVESVLMEAGTHWIKVETWKKIASLLSVGTDLKNKENDFEASEDFVLGHCEKTSFHMKKNPQDSEKEIQPKFDLNVIPISVSNERTKIELTKIRDIASCNGTDKYFMHSSQDNNTVIFTSSISKMTITSEGTFESSNEHLGKMINSDGTEVGIIEELFVMKLNSIRPATEDLHQYENPKTQSLILQAESEDGPESYKI